MDTRQLIRIQENIARRLFVVNTEEQQRFYPADIVKRRSVKIQKQLTEIIERVEQLNELQPTGGRGALTEPLYTDEEQKKIDDTLNELDRLKDRVLRIQDLHDVSEFGEPIDEFGQPIR